MAEHCLVMCGDWRCSTTGHWEFIVDKSLMSRVVSVYVGISMDELKKRVVSEFFPKGKPSLTVTVSYWPPNTTELATGIRTPPVLLTNEGSISFFFKHYHVNHSMNLFVTFGCENSESPDPCYITPANAVKRANRFDDLHGFAKIGRPVSVGVGDDVGSFSCSSRDAVSADVGMFRGKKFSFEDIGCSDGKGFEKGKAFSEGSSSGCVQNPVDVTDDDFLKNEKLMEDVFFGDPQKLKSSGFVDGLIASDSDDSCGEFPSGACDVRPVGYNQEFWRPLISDPFGGSDAVDIMCPPTDGFDGKAAALGKRRQILCSSNDAFDHFVLTGGASPDVKIEGLPAKKSTGPLSEDGRSLEHIDDEEFDIPPMFDDTKYVSDDIPDLDIDEGGEGIYEGKLFNSKEECQIALAIYAIKEMFHFKQSTTKRHYFIVSCVDQSCDWRVRAKEVGDCGYYEIQKAKLGHTCCIDTRNAYRKRASSRVIAAVFRAKYGDPEKGPRASQLQRMVLEELRVQASYMKCYRAKEQASVDVRGTEEESYLRLPAYFHMLKLANPGTVTDIETEVDVDGNDRFLYAFLAFGGSITGFSRLRRVIVIDGTHLWGKYKGVLLTACGQDANFQVYPLAYAVVDSENNESWTWFLQRLERILGDSSTLVIVSDRAKSVYAAIAVAYPLAVHVACIVHLARNVSSIFSCKGLGKLVTLAAFAFRPAGFKPVFEKIKSRNIECARYLEKIGMSHWARCYCKGERYNFMTSNAAEQLNKALKEGRGCPIVELFMFVQAMMTRWFNARRNKSANLRGPVTPEVEKVMKGHIHEVAGSHVNQISSWSFEVVGKFGDRNTVLLSEKRCSCKKFDRLQIPCGHALLAADTVGVLPSTLVGLWNRPCSWKETFIALITPGGNEGDVDLPRDVTDLILCPPMTGRAKGRRKEARIPSRGEFPVVRKKKEVPNKCTRCLKAGHNRTSCPGQI